MAWYGGRARTREETDEMLKQHKRNDSDIEILEKIKESPRVIKNFLSKDETNYLADLLVNGEGVEDGMVIVGELPSGDPVYENILKRIWDLIGKELPICSGTLFRTYDPYLIHNDVPKNKNKLPYKGFLMPLRKVYSSEYADDYEGKDSDASVYFFKNRYYHYPIKCQKGDSVECCSRWALPMYDYSGCHPPANATYPIDYSLNIENPERVQGLDVEANIEWVTGDLVIFDIASLHGASSFSENGINCKIGISVFTEFVK